MHGDYAMIGRKNILDTKKPIFQWAFLLNRVVAPHGLEPWT